VYKKLILGIDYNNLMMAGTYQKQQFNQKGEAIEALLSFFFRLSNMKKNLQPDYIVMGVDVGRDKTFRRKIYPPYKANRPGSQDPMVWDQLRHGLTMLSLMGYPTLSNPDYEADDVLGMVSRFGELNNMDVLLATADRDYYQLITDHTNILSTRLKVVIDKEWIMETYELEPKHLIEVKGLAGDSGDNIPGVNGIGEKTAIKLIKEYGSMETVYDNMHNMNPVIVAMLERDKEIAFLSRMLGTIVTDYTKIDLDLNKIEFQEPNIPELNTFMNEKGLHSLLSVMRYGLLDTKPQINQNIIQEVI
jgi:DNA polymerase-1